MPSKGTFRIPIRIWLKYFESVIETIVLYGCEVWSPAHQPIIHKMGQTCTQNSAKISSVYNVKYQIMHREQN
jgi:hypothetical protein